MKLTVNRALFASVVKPLAQVINTKNVLPILGDMLFEVKDCNLTLTASDSEVTMSTTIPLDTMEGEGRFCVPADKLTAALAEVMDEKVTIVATTESDNRFTLQHSKGETYFPLESADEYPLPATEAMNKPAHTDSKLVSDALKRALWATAHDELRPQMEGVCFSVENDMLDIVASDGHVLVKTSVNDITDADKNMRIIVPKKAATVLAKVLSVGPLDISYNATSCRFTFTPFTLTATLTDGKYPNYNSVIPKDQPLMATASRIGVLSSLKAILPFSPDSSKLTRLHFKDNRLTIAAEDYDMATGATSSVSVDYPHDELAIGVSGVRLATILSKLTTNEVFIHLNDPSTAIVIEQEDTDDDCDVTMLTMPMIID